MVDFKKPVIDFEYLFTVVTEGILVSNPQGEIVMANPAAIRLFGYSEEEFASLKIENLVPSHLKKTHSDHRKAFFSSPANRPMGIGMALFAMRKDGSIFPVEISLSHVENESGRFVVTLITDITKRKRQEDALLEATEELSRYSEKLSRSNRDLEEFAYVASHDLQEPLRKIMAFGDRLKKLEQGKLQPKSEDYLERVVKAAGRMQQLINDLLAFSRITSRAQPYEKVNLNTELAKVLDDLVVTVQTKKAKIKADVLPSIEAEPTQIRQLFQNLILNAIKFSKEGVQPEIRITHKIHHRVTGSTGEQQPDFLEIIISDNGIGFDPVYKDKIFTIFQRLEGSKYEGSGIGLAICAKIVNSHGGVIEADSSPGEGAVFTIKLPMKQYQKSDSK